MFTVLSRAGTARILARQNNFRVRLVPLAVDRCRRVGGSCGVSIFSKPLPCQPDFAHCPNVRQQVWITIKVQSSFTSGTDGFALPACGWPLWSFLSVPSGDRRSSQGCRGNSPGMTRSRTRHATPRYERSEIVHCSRKARLNWSVSGFDRNDSAVLCSVETKTSTGMPGKSLLSPSLANSTWATPISAK